MADYVNAKFDSEKNFAAGELMSMTGEQYSIAKTMGVAAYREVQRALRANKSETTGFSSCCCATCTIRTWQRAQAQIAKLANREATNGKV